MMSTLETFKWVLKQWNRIRNKMQSFETIIWDWKQNFPWSYTTQIIQNMFLFCGSCFLYTMIVSKLNNFCFPSDFYVSNRRFLFPIDIIFVCFSITYTSCQWCSVTKYPKSTFDIDFRNLGFRSCSNEINGNTFVLSKLRIRY